MTKECLVPSEITLAQVGNYRFTGRVLGKGSFAVIKEAIHTQLKVNVSVKTINLKKCNHYTLRNYLREGAILRQLDHPYIMRLFETITHNDIYYMVTEMILGGDLCSYVQHKKGKVEENITRRFSRQIGSALRYLHNKGIVHRDLKLENVMLDSAKRNIKLIDFGLTNHWSQNCPLKTLCGSPEYCAPELFISGTVYGPEVDMWAFGVIMFAMAAGRLPFPCLSSIMKVPEKKNQFLRTINHGLSETQTNLLKVYSPEFTQLVKGLMNPIWKERLTIKDVFQDTWFTNRNHWVDVIYETLDAYDVEEIVQKLSYMLKVSSEQLKLELKLRPYGEAGGFFQIMTYEVIHKRSNRPTIPDNKLKLSQNERSNYSSCGDTSSKKLFTKQEPPKLSLIGSAMKLNEVTFTSSHSSCRDTSSKKLFTKQEPPKLSLIGSAMKLNEVTFTSSPARDNVSTPSDSSTLSGEPPEFGFKDFQPKRQTKILLQKMGCLKTNNLCTPFTSTKVPPRRESKAVQVNTITRKKHTRTTMRDIPSTKLKMTISSKSLWVQDPHWLRKLF